MKIINYLSILFILVLLAGCTIDLRGGVPTVEFNKDAPSSQLQDKIVEDVTPNKEVITPIEANVESSNEEVKNESSVTIIPDENIVYVSLEEILKHNQFNDCWIILEGKVYNAKILISTHPSGRMVINYCGKDATEFIKTQLFKGDVDFLENAKGYLEQSYIGEYQ